MRDLGLHGAFVVAPIVLMAVGSQLFARRRRTPASAVEIVGSITVGMLLSLLLSGVWLYFFYVPQATPMLEEWAPLLDDGSGAAPAAWVVQDGHRWVSSGLLFMALAFGVVLLIERWSLLRGAAAAVALLAIVAVGVVGYMVRWDQIGVWAVVVGNLDGYEFLHDDIARFVIVHGRRVSVGSFMTLLYLHMSLGAAILVGLWLLWRRSPRGAGDSRSGSTGGRHDATTPGSCEGSRASRSGAKGN